MELIKLFENALSRVYFFLRLVGLGIDPEDRQRNFMERLYYRRIYCLHFIELNLDLIGEVLWLADGIINGKGAIEEYTNLLPGLTLGLLGDLKTYFMLRYAHHVLELIHSFKSQYTDMILDDRQKEIIKRNFVFLTATNRFLAFTFGFGVSMFAIGPLIVMMTIYYSTGQVELKLPFIVLYPFDSFKFPMWPIIYVAQIWSAVVATIFVYGPDCFYYTSCMFIHIQFNQLQHDIQDIIARYPNENGHNQSYYSEFVKFVNRHRELIRCVDLLEIIYSKSTLFNVVSSSLIICVTGFNIMVIKDPPLMVAFTFFLTVGFVQICLFCYYGEILIQSSSKVTDAIYNSKWYECSVANMKDYLFVLTRAQKPCKLTAYGFSVISLNSFAKILSTSWSYFALLLTLYSGSQIRH